MKGDPEEGLAEELAARKRTIKHLEWASEIIRRAGAGACLPAIGIEPTPNGVRNIEARPQR